MHLAPDDPRLREIASASHAKEIGRFVPGEEVGGEIVAHAAEPPGSSLAGSARDGGVGERLFEVLLDAARRRALGPGANPCAVCMGLGECRIDDASAASASDGAAAG